VYSARRGNSADIVSKRVGSEGETTPLVGTPLHELAPAWSPGQKHLIYSAVSAGVKSQLLYRERHGDGTLGDAIVFLKTAFHETLPRFSPDGRYVAYVSDESGRNEVYVRDFPSAANKRQISRNGGTTPRWSGKELFYMGERGLFAAAVRTSPEFSAGSPAMLFERRGISPAFDVSGDGKRFVVLEKPAGEPPLSVHVVHNWFSEFREQGAGARKP
jgi:serine/threonine-protein kinase